MLCGHLITAVVPVHADRLQEGMNVKFDHNCEAIASAVIILVIFCFSHDGDWQSCQKTCCNFKQQYACSLTLRYLSNPSAEIRYAATVVMINP